MHTEQTMPYEVHDSSRSKRWLAGIGIGILCGVLALVLLYTTPVLDGIENVSWSWRAKWIASPTETTKQINIIAIDDASLNWVENKAGVSWPWPREIYGHILSYLKRAPIHSLTADLLFEQEQTVASDQALAESIRQGPPVIAAFSLSDSTGPDEKLPTEISRFFTALPPTQNQQLPQKFMTTISRRFARFPIPELWPVISSLGNVITEPDSDGVIRRVPLVRLYQNKIVPSLALASVALGKNLTLNEISDAPALVSPSVPRRVLLGQNAEIILRYRGPAQTYQTISAAAILQSEWQIREGKTAQIDPMTFRQKRILLGITATGGTGGFDLKATPVSKTMCGAEINATAIDNLISGDWMTPPSRLTVIFAVLLSTVLTGLICLRFSKSWQNLLLIPLTLATLLGASIVLYKAGFWWPVAGHGIALLITIVLMIAYHYATEGRRRRFIQNAFMHYLSPKVIAELITHPDQLRLGGHRRPLTIFFSDLQGFTSISERLEPEHLTQLLNEYLGEMTEIILDCGGTLDKYEGDAIIAFWNAPVSQADHAERGVLAALLCQKKLAQRRREWQQRYGVALHMRIGMHTGDAIVGNMGSGRRFDYTMLGDAPNLASRLEGVNKVFGTTILVSGSTWSLTSDRFQFGRIGRILVVGRQTPVDVYTPYGDSDQEREPAYDEIAEAVELCLQQKWEEALPLLNRHLAFPAAQAYLTKLEECQNKWDGIWHLNEK